jgi:uncharacterized membrane protein (DUF2068 family)
VPFRVYNRAVRRDGALWLIIGYKLVKGALWFVFAAVILVGVRLGLEERLLGLAEHLRHHARAWSLELARLIVSAASRRGLWTIAVALIADGSVSLLEGWALLHGRWWGPWLVVVATGSLLPFELVALAHRPHVVRAVLLVLNLVIVVYLARKAMSERREGAVNGQEFRAGKAEKARASKSS